LPDSVQQETDKSVLLDRITAIIAICMGIYHFASSVRLFVYSDIHVAVHFLFSLLILFLQALKLGAGSKADKSKNGLMILLAAASVVVTVYIAAHYTEYKMSMGVNSAGKIVSGAIYLAIFLIVTWMKWGKVIPVIVVATLLYGYFGPHIPGIFYHGGLSIARLITYSTTNFTGVFGMLGGISANTIVLFSIFAGMMQAFGALECIMNVAMSASGKIRSGSAQVAVISSGLIGSVTGSVAANISMTGTVSIPLMKRRGYPNEFAAACESAASTGGALLPPVMNAAAFIIASWTNTPYITVALLGATPALLYYLGISLTVYIKAIKLGDERVTDDSLQPFKKVAKEFLVFIIPLVVLVIFLIKMYSPQISLFYAILTLMAIGLIREALKGGSFVKEFIKKILNGFDIGSKSVASIAVVMGIMGIVVQILTATGLPSKISQFVITVAGDSLFLLAIFVAITCIVFGMGMPAAPAYVLAALLGAPALTSYGVPLLAAHFFVFYYGELSAITPPVAIGCLVASGMAGSNFMKTCLESIRLAIVGFVIPYLFLYRPAVLGLGTVTEYFWAVLMVIAFVFAFILACENFFLMRLTLFERLVSVAACVLSVIPHIAFDLAGLALVAVLLISHLRRKRRIEAAV